MARRARVFIVRFGVEIIITWVQSFVNSTDRCYLLIHPFYEIHFTIFVLNGVVFRRVRQHVVLKVVFRVRERYGIERLMPDEELRKLAGPPLSVPWDFSSVGVFFF